jgi:ribosomal RNA-processing protein 8
LEETKKAKKKSRKKRLKQKQRILGPKEELEEIAGVSGQKPIQVSTKTQDQMVARLDASRFRYLNEQLYTKPSTSAAQLFQEDPNAFVAYHKGYQQQV